MNNTLVNICCVQNNYGCFFHGGVPRGRDACHAGDAGSSVAVASSSYRSDIGRIA